MKTTSYLLATVLALGLSGGAMAEGEAFSAKLNGAQQVRTATILDSQGSEVSIPIGPLVTGAYGHAHFKLSPDGTMLHYEFEATGFSTPLFMAHIHLGPKGANGGVLFWLFADASNAPFTPPRDDGPFTGSISGVLTADDLSPMPGLGVNTFEDAVANIMNGNTYVNLHTTANPGGEIRGQIKHKKMDKRHGPPFGRDFPFGRGNSPFGPGFPFER